MRHTTDRQLAAYSIARAYLEDNERHLELCERDGIEGGLSAFVHYLDRADVSGPRVRVFVESLSRQQLKHQILGGDYPLVLNKLKGL